MEYNGLQLVHMTYEKAYEFAGEYGMNAVLVDLKDERHGMFMCRLKQASDGKLRIGNHYIDSQRATNFNANIINEEDYDIYWIGLR